MFNKNVEYVTWNQTLCCRVLSCIQNENSQDENICSNTICGRSRKDRATTIIIRVDAVLIEGQYVFKVEQLHDKIQRTIEMEKT